ncbi:MAG: FAD-dependent oxidoreductase [Candidatus Electryonea clarkiae]|nr:FAD-dependent oxidoreductase [Candidatus Electryonea clarkiae]MDP8288042.1 FAD-dependent oxidoreductase [Candidatus Electryonea clarkiae]
MDEEFEVLIIGAGPAGIAAAISLAREGFEVMVLERGEYAGSKNVFGGIFFTHQLLKLLPEALENAPLERAITKRRFCVLSSEKEVGVDVKIAAWRDKPYNHTMTALRGRFDRWFADQAETEGANVIPEILVSELLIENGKVVGVKTEPGGEEMRAKVVISAEGAQAFLARKAGLMAKELPKRHMITNIKEVISMPREKIEDRFLLENGEGVAIEYFGDVVKGNFGSGFIYTNEESISIGLGLTIHDLINSKKTLNDFLEDFKKHPTVRKLIEGGETIEYAAHMIPEYGYNHLPKMSMPGLMLVGDTAGLINGSVYHEGTNLAMGSGLLAAETLIEAKKNGLDIGSAEALQPYRQKLENTFVLKDMYKFRKVPDFLNKFPHYLQEYPGHITQWLQDYFTVDETPKAEVEKGILNKIKKDIGLWRLTVDMFRLGRNMR